MPDLRRAGEDIVDRPLFDPTPVAELEARAGVLLRQRRRRLTALSVVATVALVLALAGAVGLADTAGRKKGTVATGVPSVVTTTSLEAGETPSPDQIGTTATTVAAGVTTTANAGTATTAKATATTAKKAPAGAPKS